MLLALICLAAVAGGGPPSATWEKVYETSGRNGLITDVWAAGHDEWFVGGYWGVTHMSRAGALRHETDGIPVIGLFGESASRVFAFGPHELVLHFDRDRWTEEHAVRRPARPPSAGDDLLQYAFYPPDEQRSRLIAFGPHLVIERNEDGSWTTPREPERQRLETLAVMGPPERPSGCLPDAWLWVGKARAFVGCQDRRAFLYQSGRFTPAGKVPRGCAVVARIALANGTGDLVCTNKTIWAIEGQTWRKLQPPKDTDDDYTSISAADGCLFLTARHTVWRSCRPSIGLPGN